MKNTGDVSDRNTKETICKFSKHIKRKKDWTHSAT